MKRGPSDWLKIVKLYVDDGVPMSKLAEKYHFHVSHLKHKINVYLIHGKKPFTDEQEKRIYAREEIRRIISLYRDKKEGIKHFIKYRFIIFKNW